MVSLFTNCYPSEFDRAVQIPQKTFMGTCLNKLRQVSPTEKREFKNNYYIRRDNYPTPGTVQIQKKRFDAISPEDLSAGMVYTNKGFFGGKRKSQRRNKKTRKQRRKTRKNRSRRM
jgi:hypothetical protein